MLADSLADGVLDVAPSQNAVFDALATKADSAAASHYDLTNLATGFYANVTSGSLTGSCNTTCSLVFQVGDEIVVNSQQRIVMSTTAGTFSVDKAFTASASNAQIFRVRPGVRVLPAAGDLARVSIGGDEGIRTFDKTNRPSLLLQSTMAGTVEMAQIVTGTSTTSANGRAMSIRGTGSIYPSSILYTDGSIGLGGGAADAPDVFLRRLPSHVLYLDGDKAGTTAADLGVSGRIVLDDGALSGNTIAIKAPSSVGANLTYTLPGTASNGKFLQTNGSGTLSWVAALASDGGTMSGDIDMNSKRIKNLPAPSSGSDAVNRDYADGKLAGSNVDLSGLVNGTALVWDAPNSKWKVGTASVIDTTRVAKVGDAMTGTLNVNGPGTNFSGTSAAIDVRGTETSLKDIFAVTHGGSSNVSSILMLGKTDGSVASPATTLPFSRLGTIQFNAYNAGYKIGALIDAVAMGTTTSNGPPTKIDFYTNDGTGNAMATRMTIKPAGGVEISDSGNNGGNVPHQCAAVVGTSSLTPLNSMSCSATQIAIGGGGGCTGGSLIASGPNVVGSKPVGWSIACSSGTASMLYAICCSY